MSSADTSTTTTEVIELPGLTLDDLIRISRKRGVRRYIGNHNDVGDGDGVQNDDEGS